MHATQHLEMYIITPGTPGGCSKTIKFIIVIVFYNDSKSQTLKDKLVFAVAVVNPNIPTEGGKLTYIFLLVLLQLML